MKAMVITGFGGPEVFSQVELPTPTPGPGELLVRIYATSVNPIDYKMRRNGTWAGLKPPALIGFDVAGVVEAVGPGARDFKVGDKVFYTPHVFGHPGTYAEYQVVEENIVSQKPSNLTFAQAASLPLAGCTAWDALMGLCKVGPTDTVLIHAGAGGVGSLAVQIARAAGARVLTTARVENEAMLRDLGADAVIDYHQADWPRKVLELTEQKGVTVTFDTVGGETLAKSIAAMRPYGRMVSVVNVEGSLNAAFGKNLTVHFLFLERARHKMEALRVLAERGKLRAVIDSVMPLEQVAEAHRRIERGGMKGKIVLEVSPKASEL